MEISYKVLFIIVAIAYFIIGLSAGSWVYSERKSLFWAIFYGVFWLFALLYFTVIDLIYKFTSKV